MLTNPPPQNVPGSLARDANSSAYLRALNKAVFLLWRRDLAADDTAAALAEVVAALAESVAVLDETVAALGEVGAANEVLGSDGTNREWVRRGSVLQQVRTWDGAYASSTTTMPKDDTIPQITEGAEFLSVTITPVDATSTLVVEANMQLSTTALGDLNAALFRDSTADAIAAVSEPLSSGKMMGAHLAAFVAASSTTSTTFTARAGVNGSGTVEFNGQNAARILGGVCASWLTVTEHRP